MKKPPSAAVLVLGLLGSLGAAYLASTYLAAAPPKAKQPRLEAPSSAVETGEAASAVVAVKPRKPAAYQVIEVVDGGTIRIACRLTQAPPNAPIPLNKDRPTPEKPGCGHASMPNERCVFDPATLGLSNCIVSLTDIQKGKGFEGELAEEDREVVLDQKGCSYKPHVMLVRRGARVAIKNSDPVQHNVKCFFNSRSMGKFNVMSSSGSLIPSVEDTTLDKAGHYLLLCDIHFWMTGFIRAASHPYVALTGADGSATLTNVPPGRYAVGCWHEGMLVKVQSSGAEVSGYEFSPDITLPDQMVDVPAGGTVDVTFLLDPK